MRTVSSAFETAIAENCVRICELYIFALADGTTYRYTDHDKNITWDTGSNTYTPINGKRGPVRYNSDGQADECQVDLAMISGDLVELAANNGLENAVLTIKRIRWNATYAADEEIQLFVGKPDVGYDGREMTLNFRSIFSSLNILVPAHSYQESCNYILFDSDCGLTQSDYAYAGTASDGSQTSLVDATAGTLYKVDFDGGDETNPIERGDAIEGQAGAGTAVAVQVVYLTATSGTLWYLEQSGVQFVDDEEIQNAGADSIIVNGTPAEDLEFFFNGEVEMTSGDNSGQRRPVQIRSGSTLTPKWPFVSAVANGDTYKIYPGCDGRVEESCLNKFCNKDGSDRLAWDGYPWIPRVEETIF